MAVDRAPVRGELCAAVRLGLRGRVGAAFRVASCWAPGSAAPYVKPENRKPAEDFVRSDASGNPVRLSDLRGKVVRLNFGATWCAPCRLEIPWFVEFQKTYRNEDFAILAVSLDQDGWNAVRPYIQTRNVNYTVVTGSDEVARLYDADSLPTTLIIDRSGRVAARRVGLCGKNGYESEIRTVAR